MAEISSIILHAREAINTEISALSFLPGRIDAAFESSVRHILESKGRVVITGIGKSAVIAQKIVATLNSTGTPSIFMHAADAIHGDLGIIQDNDVIICISKSGNTPEIKALVPLLRRGQNKLVSIVGNTESYLAKQSDFVLDASVEKEACPNDLAPTSSTTAQLVLGDALAVCLLRERKFTKDDFARFHPGGALGKRLYLTLQDIASGNQKPSVLAESSIKEAIMNISQNRMGATVVMQDDEIIGIITDGDIRRMLEKHSDLTTLKAKDVMGVNPVCLDAETLAADAAKVMSDAKISQIIVTGNKKYLGMVHIHDLNREGII